MPQLYSLLKRSVSCFDAVFELPALPCNDSKRAMNMANLNPVTISLTNCQSVERCFFSRRPSPSGSLEKAEVDQGAPLQLAFSAPARRDNCFQRIVPRTSMFAAHDLDRREVECTLSKQRRVGLGQKFGSDGGKTLDCF
jgi:hypothetical protein